MFLKKSAFIPDHPPAPVARIYPLFFTQRRKEEEESVFDCRFSVLLSGQDWPVN